MESGLINVGFRLLAVLTLVLANGFFVAAEFAIISVRKTRIDQLLAEGSRMARPVRRALDRPDQYIAATQLGITMASLGLGWIGEPALASMLHPLLAPPRHDLAGHGALAGGCDRVHHHHIAPHRPRRARAENRCAAISRKD